MATSSTTSIYMGSTLKLCFDESSSTLDLLCDDGTVVDMWGQTLSFAFDAQQVSVQLLFSPVDTSYTVAAACQDAAGNTTPSQPRGNDTSLTISGPPSVGESFDILLANSTSTQSAVAGGSSARLQIRLVFTTAEPPPDPDARPILTSTK